MRSIARLVAALSFAAAAAWVPTGTALACSCAFNGYPEMIGMADVAVIGTVVGSAEPVAGDGMAFDGGPFELVRYTLDVSRSKSDVVSPMPLHAVAGDGANCGMTMSAGEEWLVLAMVEDGVPTTHLCSGSALIQGLDDDSRALVDEALTVIPETADPAPAGLELPVPLLLALGAAAVIGAVSVLAFRRHEAG